jgi:glycosidase
VVFPDQEDSIWEYDERSGEWYLHHFYKHQPDLNIDNPAVRDEISKVMGFWMELGVSGFRVDAVPFLLGTEGAEAAGVEEPPDPHDYLRALRGFQTRRSGDSMMLGEVNLPHEEQLAYFGGEGADELTMVFDFVVMQQMYLSLARHDARPLADALAARPVLPVRSQWASFVRNHDELTLDKLTDAERQEVFDAFGPEESMQLFGRGLRRRLPPMLDGDQQRIRMVYSLMFSLPGTPVLFYGEEIGMGENLDLDGRMAVRSPMQWTDQQNGGFSFAAPDQLVRSLTGGEFAPDQVNAAAQLKDPDSLLGFVSRLIHTYRQSPELGWSAPHVLEQPYDEVLAHQCVWDDRRMVLLHNLGPEPRTVPLQLEADGPRRLADKLSDHVIEVDRSGRVDVELDGYGYRWMGVVPERGKQLA